MVPRIYYEVHGEGEAIVLVHGYPLNSGLFSVRSRSSFRSSRSTCAVTVRVRSRTARGRL